MVTGKEIGAPRARQEDIPLIQGESKFTDDLHRDDALHMAVLRSQYGHAEIVEIDVSGAISREGVVAAYTWTDIERSDGSGIIPTPGTLHNVDDVEVPVTTRVPLFVPKRPLLADDRVKYMGEPIAIVLAENRYIAHEALSLVEVSYERLDAVIDPNESASDRAVQVHEEREDNVAFDWEIGDSEAVDEAFEAADRTVTVDLGQQRISPTSMEPRSALAEFAPSTGKLTVHMGTQSPHAARELMSDVLGLPPDKVRVIAPEVGGGFGCKSKWYPAEPLAAWSSIRTGRPVKWQATRSESHLSDIHGRGRTVSGELAFDNDGTIRGLRVDSDANLGAYVSRVAPGTRTGSFVDTLSGQYKIPAIHCRVRGIFTNTTPVDSYRGSSRPMTILTVERLVYLAAHELGMDPAELRRRNFISSELFPYDTPVGEAYDSGAYEEALDRALELADYEAERERQERLRKEGRYVGIGISCVMDNAGTSAEESGRIKFHPSGSVTAYHGSADQGQGHRTTFAQLVADLLGVPFDDVEVKGGDTEKVPVGGGASGSRTVVCGGEALREAAEKIVEKARRIAADRFEIPAADVEFGDGVFTAPGATSRALRIQEVAQLAHSDADVPGDVEPGLEAECTLGSPATFPFGTHVAVVEVDVETGDVDIEKYVAVDDCGVQLNPKLVEGQIVGGVVQGIGQALYEDAVYDDNGTLVTSSMQDYAVPRSIGTPDVITDSTVTPSPYNSLGVKGVGESGATGAPAAIANAVADALIPFGVTHLDLPITPELVWRTVDEATAAGER